MKELYIIEFDIEYIESYSQVEEKYKAIPRKRFSEKIPLLLKMIFIEKEIMTMNPNSMTS